MDRRFLAAIACLVLVGGAVIPAGASTLMKLTLSGIGTDMSLTNFSFGISGNYVQSGSGWQVQNGAVASRQKLETVPRLETRH